MCLWGPMGRHFLIFWGRYAPLRSVKVSEENLYWGSAPCRPVLCWDTKSRGLGFLIPPLMRVLVWFQSTWMTSQLSTWLSTHRTSSVGRVIFVGLLLVFLSYFVPPLLVLRERWTALILASWWLLWAHFFLALWVTGSLQLGCLEHSLQSLSLRLPVFVICSVYPLLLSVVFFPVTYPFLQDGESPIIPNISWSHLTGNLSYSRVRTCDGSYMELRCLFFIAAAFAFIFLNFNKPLTFLLMWGRPNPRLHSFNVYWRDLRKTVVFHFSRKSCTLFVKSTGLLWSRLNIKPPKGFWHWLLVQTLGDYVTLRKPSCSNSWDHQFLCLGLFSPEP